MSDFIVSKTFERYTQEGEEIEDGFVFEEEKCTLREALDHIDSLGSIDSHNYENFYPCDMDQDYRTGEWERNAVHVRCISKPAQRAFDKCINKEIR